MSWEKRDKAVIWHPFTQMKTEKRFIPIVKGEGAHLIDDEGNRYIDAISSWWTNLHGHGHPYIAERVGAQAKQLEHVMFAGFTHPPAIELAERLLDKLPKAIDRIFYSDNGSTAVEVALKMAFQYWHNQGKEKNKVIAFENGYHGDTFGAMSVSERDAYTAPFSKNLFDVHYIPVPTDEKLENCLQQLKIYLERGDVAAIIFEPLVQGAGCMNMYPAANLDKVIKLAKAKNTLVIADEVMTGFGRTGKLFAADHLEHKPDIMCLSKGLTGGTMALGVTACTDAIYKQFYADDKLKTFFHGHSFTANPLACAASLASLDLLEKESCQSQIQFINVWHREFLEKIKDHPKVVKPRITGTILAFDLKTDEKTGYFHSQRDSIYDYFINKNLLIRPLGNTIYLLPPYCITKEQLTACYSGILGFLEKGK